jgi:FMN phosphatase YigB (HAD superfamily)
MSPVCAVWFDVGEVLINETREYGSCADWLAIPRHTFSAMFGAVTARGEDYRQVFQYFRPSFDLDTERQARLNAGLGEYLNGTDLYPDVRPCLHALKDAGYFVGIAGNQTTRAGRFLRELNLPCDVLATSGDWGVAKPDIAFFSKLIAVSDYAPHEIASVGDRLDNDLCPAARWPAHHFCPSWPVGLHHLPARHRRPRNRHTHRTPRCAQDVARRLTQAFFRPEVPPAGLSSGMVPRVARGPGYPVASAPQAELGQGIRSFSACGAPP